MRADALSDNRSTDCTEDDSAVHEDQEGGAPLGGYLSGHHGVVYIILRFHAVSGHVGAILKAFCPHLCCELDLTKGIFSQQWCKTIHTFTHDIRYANTQKQRRRKSNQMSM